MEQTKRRRLEGKGWKLGNVDQFLGLTPEETALVELRLALSRSVREYRRSRKLTQVALARLLNSSQSRVAKLEAGEASVSLDLLIRSLLTMGATPKDLARIIAASGGAR